MELRFVSADSRDYAMLASQLDTYYFTLVGEIQLRYAEANRPENFSDLVVAYEHEHPIGIGCWKKADKDTAEIKRIYVAPEHRRKGVASQIIRVLEGRIAAAGFQRIILETARTTKDSSALYLSLGYHETAYYGSPAGVDYCLCFAKLI